MAAEIEAGPIQSQEQGASSGSPKRTRGPKDLSHPMMLFQAVARSWIRGAAARTQTDTHVRHRTVGKDLGYYAMVPAPLGSL